MKFLVQTDLVTPPSAPVRTLGATFSTCWCTNFTNIANNGCNKILNPIIKLDIFKSVFSIFCDRIIPAAKRAQGAAEPEIKFKALSILRGIGYG